MCSNLDRKLEAQADTLLKQHHAAARGSEYPAYSEKYLGGKFAIREMSIEQMCEQAGLVIGVPPPNIARLIAKSARRIAARADLVAFVLHDDLGWPAERIATLTKCAVRTVYYRVARARQGVRDYLDEDTQTVRAFIRESARHQYHRPPQRPNLPCDLARAREVLEEHGYQTSVVDNQGTRIRVEPPEGATPITRAQVIAWAKRLEARN